MSKNLKNTIKKLAIVIRKEKFIFSAFLLDLILLLIMMSFGNEVAIALTKNLMNERAATLQQVIDNELKYALQQSKEITGSDILSRYIEANDAANALSVLNEEKEKRNLGFLAVVNKKGITLAYSPFTNIHGDYPALTTPWGRSAAQGKGIATIGVDRNFPLVFSGAYPIIRDEKVEGAIYSGFLLNDEYAAKLKEKYFKNGLQIVFYSKQEGITGDSFQDESIKKLVLAAFNQGSEWLQNDRSDEFVRINNNDYFLKNIVFPDPETSKESIGGALLFLPHGTPYQSIILSFLSILLFLPLAIYILLKRPPIENAQQKKQALMMVAIIALLTGIGAFYLNQFRTRERIITIKEPSYTIYNSTLEFEPDENIIDLASEQQISIRLDTGGEAINAVQTIINYDPSMVRVEDILTTDSLCAPEFFLEKEIDNERGEARITCGLPDPGFVGSKGTIAELLIHPLRTGDLKLNFGEETKVLANDGLGTNVLRMTTNASYQVASLESSQTSIDKIPFPQINLFSPSHPNSERWYNKKDIRIFWPSYSGYSYAYLFDKIPDSVLRGGIGLIASDSSITLRADSDGIYYFHIAANKEGKIGPTSHLKIKIDTTLPLPPTIKASETQIKAGELVRLEFGGGDEMSGLQPTYFIKIDGEVRFPSLPQLYIVFPEKGKRILSVRVFDNANNFRDSDIEINVK